QRALLAGDAVNGISIMQMDAGPGTGAIFLQDRISIAGHDTGGTLHDKLAGLGGGPLVRALSARAVAPGQAGERANHRRRIRKEEAAIDWRRPAEEIDRQVRAFDPAPGSQTLLERHPLKIWRARVEPDAEGSPGVVCAIDTGIVVACGRGGLRVTEVQRAGGRRLAAADFLAGFKLGIGTRLGAGDG